MNYTQQQFNEMAGKAEEVGVLENVSSSNKHFLVIQGSFNKYNPYEDLNQLMPLAWKYDINITFEFNDITGKYWNADTLQINANDKDPIQAIRDCLWSIWQEGNTNE